MAPVPLVSASVPPKNCGQHSIVVHLSRNGVTSATGHQYNYVSLHNMAPGQPIQIQFHYQLTNSTVLTWETMYVGNTLYIRIPNQCSPNPSKDALVALLEYAEVVLSCDRAIVYFPNDICGRDTLIRTFMFMGLFPVPWDCPLLPFHEEKNVYLVYKIY